MKKNIFLFGIFLFYILQFQSCGQDITLSTDNQTGSFVKNAGMKKSPPSGSIVPGKKWLDTNGNEIKCQGGEIYQENGVFYWVGGNFNGNDWRFAGINLYSSTDLKNWTFRNTILTPASISAAINPAAIVDLWVGRPVLTKKPNGQYIIIMGTGLGGGSVGNATCSTIDGNYTWQSYSKLLGHYNFNDHDIFKDTDGKTYIIFSTAQDLNTGNWYDAVITQCDPNTMLPTSEVCRFGNGALEGVSLFKNGSYYYFFGSQKDMWNGTSTKWYKSATLAGFSNASWSTYTDLSYSPASTNGWDTQNDFVLQVNGNYYYCGDRWSNFTGHGDGRYVWQPLKFYNSNPYLQWYDWWTYNSSSQTWSSTLQAGMAGGFETTDNGNWTLSFGATIVQDAANSYTATHCAKMTSYGTVSANVSVTANSTYKLQIMGKGTACTGKIFVSYNGFYLDAPVTSTSYAPISLTFTTPSNINSVTVGVFNATGSSTFIADDFELIKQ